MILFLTHAAAFVLGALAMWFLVLWGLAAPSVENPKDETRKPKSTFGPSERNNRTRNR